MTLPSALMAPGQMDKDEDDDEPYGPMTSVMTSEDGDLWRGPNAGLNQFGSCDVGAKRLSSHAGTAQQSLFCGKQRFASACQVDERRAYLQPMCPRSASSKLQLTRTLVEGGRDGKC